MNLFDAAAERAAMTTGRPVSQERAAIGHPTPTTADLPLLAPETRVVSGECSECGLAGLFTVRPGEPLRCEDGCARAPRFDIQIGPRSFVVAKGKADLQHELATMRKDGIDVLSVRPSTEPRCATHGTPLLLESGGGGRRSCPRCA